MRIAIVEDQIPESEKLKTALEQLHSEWKISFEIVCYPSGEAFLLDFEKGAFDLIFLDIYMNGMTGIETARQLRKQDNHCMLVFLTTSTEHMPDAFSCHAFEYIQKPFQLDRVRTVLKDVIQCLPQQQKYLEFIIQLEKLGVEIIENNVTIESGPKDYRMNVQFLLEANASEKCALESQVQELQKQE